ncbi:MAG: asparaginase [Chloroflexi bacterium]|nr:asparaginase [Chloroflexota bacterium]
MSRVAAIFTGGTISMRVDANLGGNVPALDGAAIVAATPGLEGIAEIEVVDLGRTPASHFTFDQLFEIAAAIRTAAASPSIDGIVVIQGTDVLEETAFFWDLVVDVGKPIVVTGAMRSASDAAYDGPANLRDAVRVAVTPAFADQGVVTCLAGAVHAADDVTKTHASALDAFQSLNDGVLAAVDGSVIRILRRRGSRRRVAASRAAAAVRLVVAGVAMDGAVIDALESIGVDGLVVEATGAGNTSAGVLEAARRLVDRGVPVVLATRCPAGAAGTDYAFPGGGATWVRAGALLPGHLTGPKARIALALGLGAGLDRPALAALLAGQQGAA